jgi:hypothetical protein
MDEEAKQLLREIRDHLAASSGRYDKAIEDNKRLYEGYLAKMQRLAMLMFLLVAAAITAFIYF